MTHFLIFIEISFGTPSFIHLLNFKPQKFRNYLTSSFLTNLHTHIELQFVHIQESVNLELQRFPLESITLL